MIIYVLLFIYIIWVITHIVHYWDSFRVVVQWFWAFYHQREIVRSLNTFILWLYYLISAAVLFLDVFTGFFVFLTAFLQENESQVRCSG